MQLKFGLLAALAGSVAAHTHMVDPPPLTSKENPNSDWNSIDYDIDSPLSGMSQYPCKGAQKLLGTKAGASVATYQPGSSHSMKIGTGAMHDGGSCQLSLSYDEGKSFTVIKSIIGGCPTAGGTWDFTVPSDAPQGEAIFAWSWINHTGNREFYMSCAVVTIGGGSKKRQSLMTKRQSAAPFDSRPQIFVANLGGEYCVPEGIDVEYPEPGPDVENNSSSSGQATICSSGEKVPSGSTGGSRPVGGNGGDTPAGGSGSDGGSDPGSGSPAPQPTTTSSPTVPSSTPSSTPSSAPPAPTPSNSTPVGGGATPPSSGDGSALSGSCENEGEWNCMADGSTYQRCASGTWTATMQMAPGTTCNSGTSSALSVNAMRTKRSIRKLRDFPRALNA